jgi:hypothetical protein
MDRRRACAPAAGPVCVPPILATFTTEPITMIPTVDDVRSSPLVHRFGDMFNLPGLTNFLGCVQSDDDVTGIRSLNFPPFATSDTVTGCLYVNGRFFKATGAPITFTWYPDRIVREAEWDGVHYHSVTILAVGRMAAAVRLAVTNRSGSTKTLDMKFGLRGSVMRSHGAWTVPPPPMDEHNGIQIDREGGTVLFSSREGGAVSCQGIFPRAGGMTEKSLATTLLLQPGEEAEVTFVHAIGETVAGARDLFSAVGGNIGAEIARAREDWNAELRAVFTPGNDRYSGFLPTLETADERILRLYHTGILGVIYFKRDTPHSVIGRAYDTLMPKWWQTVTFLWDYSLSSIVHSLLDPQVMKKYMRLWMSSDVHTHFGTEYLTGGPVGPWYSVNDFAMTTLARDYLRWSGDASWVEERVGARPVLEYLVDYANNWKQFRQPGGLADYGGLLNLLECVSTYIHQVASLNAANVFMTRFAGELLSARGDARASSFRGDAEELLAALRPLYKAGEGYWRSRFPDGSLVDVRHCYDFFTVMNTIGDDLTPAQRSEMIGFFRREFYSPTWMHALSPGDDDAMFSVRPDHQWNGAYPAWPPQALLALYRAGEADLAFRWMQGLALSANQGPFGQAHFVDPIIAPDAGGARKAPIDPPYITDWTVSSGGSWVSAIIEGLFGVRATMDKGLTAVPQFGPFDPDARLVNLQYQGSLYHVTRRGVERAR